MPSWPIHIALANKLNKKFKLNDEFILGNVLPDVLDGYVFAPSNITDKNFSHYRTNNKIDCDLFLNQNKDKLNNPFILGFFTHLLVDWFYNSYTAKNHFVKKDDGYYVLLNNKQLVQKSSDTLFMKQNEYKKYGSMLSESKLLGTPINFDNLSLENLKDLVNFNYSASDMLKATNVMNEWINNKVAIPDFDYNIYTKEELDKVYDECYKFVLDYLNKLKETN